MVLGASACALLLVGCADQNTYQMSYQERMQRLCVAQALLAPTNTGAFSESLSNAAACGQ
jgi:hypothetical protein